MGRLPIAFSLCEQTVLLSPVLYLSHYLKRNRETYYGHLQSIRERGDWESWIKFFLIGVSEVANEATETARDIVQMREAHRELIIVNLGKGAANGLRLLESLYRRPIFNVSDVAEFLGVTAQAANNLTDKFEQLNIVNEITGNKRNRVFRYDQYVELFSDRIAS